MQHGTHFVRGQVNVGLAVITLHKAVTISVARNGALELCEEARRIAGTVLSCFDKKVSLKSYDKCLFLRIKQKVCRLNISGRNAATSFR